MSLMHMSRNWRTLGEKTLPSWTCGPSTARALCWKVRALCLCLVLPGLTQRQLLCQWLHAVCLCVGCFWVAHPNALTHSPPLPLLRCCGPTHALTDVRSDPQHPLRNGPAILFLHLLGIDSNAHAHGGPASEQYLHNIQLVDDNLAE